MDTNTRLLHPARRRRRRSRGAVVFIVATTLALLALMGVYAVSGAATELRASGYTRQATQAHYLSEYAMTATANHVNSSNADYVVRTLLLGQTATPDCISVPTYTTAPGLTTSPLARACWRFSQGELEQTWAGKPLLTPQSLGQPGVSMMQGTVFAEFSNPVLTQPPPGFGTTGSGNLSFARVTVTTGGSVRPAGNAQAETLEMGRARMVIGPIR